MVLTDTPAITQFRTILQTEGVRAALIFLNRTSAHRFTAVFRFEGGTLRNLHLIDRHDPSVERCPDLPVLDSYCVYVRSTKSTFKTEDSWCDSRVEGHPKQKAVRSYCGVPLFTENGELFGTICHFDYEAIPYSEDEVYLLDAAVPFLVTAIVATEWRPELSV